MSGVRATETGGNGPSPLRRQTRRRRRWPRPASALLLLLILLILAWLGLLASVVLRAAPDGGGRIGTSLPAIRRAEPPPEPPPVPGGEELYHTCTCLNSTFTLHPDHGLLPPPRPYAFEWLHIPKTGSSFVSTLWSHACTRRGMIDLRVSNDAGGWGSHGGGGKNSSSGSGQFHDLYEAALYQRYPLETHCHRDVMGSEGLGHRPADADLILDSNVAGVFRSPEERLGSAYDHGLHSTGISDKADLYARCRYGGRDGGGNFTCYATYPGIAGCMARMLTGGQCASRAHPTVDGERLEEAVRNLRDLAFVGLTERWGETVCQFHRAFGGMPQQAQFGNVHPGARRTRADELPEGWSDRADGVVYRAAVEEFERRAGTATCYRRAPAAALGEGARCAPRGCADLGRQCGEWQDGCGGTVTCGVCNPGRDGLPSFWTARCVEGRCIRTCPRWDEAGLWHADASGAGGIAGSLRDLGAPVDGDGTEPLEATEKGLSHLTPLDAVRICAQACHGSATRPGPRAALAFAERHCSCGTYPRDYLRAAPTHEDYANAHELVPDLDPATARLVPFGGGGEEGKGRLVPLAATATLPGNSTRPRCCDPLPRRRRGRLPPREEWAAGTIQADYFETVELGCGAHDACERHGHARGATVVVYNQLTRHCHLGRNEGYDVPMSEALTKRQYLLL